MTTASSIDAMEPSWAPMLDGKFHIWATQLFFYSFFHYYLPILQYVTMSTRRNLGKLFFNILL